MAKPQPIKVYILENCTTCKKALAFLKKNKIPHEVIPIKQTAPSKDELKLMLADKKEIRKLFNSSGMEYRNRNLKDSLADLSEDEAFELLTNQGMLVKRPFLISSKVKLLGFSEKEWTEAFQPYITT